MHHQAVAPGTVVRQLFGGRQQKFRRVGGMWRWGRTVWESLGNGLPASQACAGTSTEATDRLVVCRTWCSMRTTWMRRDMTPSAMLPTRCPPGGAPPPPPCACSAQEGGAAWGCVRGKVG